MLDRVLLLLRSPVGESVRKVVYPSLGREQLPATYAEKTIDYLCQLPFGYPILAAGMDVARYGPDLPTTAATAHLSISNKASGNLLRQRVARSAGKCVVRVHRHKRC